MNGRRRIARSGTTRPPIGGTNWPPLSEGKNRMGVAAAARPRLCAGRPEMEAGWSSGGARYTNAVEARESRLRLTAAPGIVRNLEKVAGRGSSFDFAQLHVESQDGRLVVAAAPAQ